MEVELQYSSTKSIYKARSFELAALALSKTSKHCGISYIAGRSDFQVKPYKSSSHNSNKNEMIGCKTALVIVF